MEKEKFDKDRFYEFPDRTQAFDYCKKCVEDDENDVNALLILGECYYLGVGTEVDEKEACKIFKRVIKLVRTNKVAKKFQWKRKTNIFFSIMGFIFCLFLLNFFIASFEIRPNTKNEFKTFQEKHEQELQELQEKIETNPNDSASWYRLGKNYHGFMGKGAGEEKAFECYKKANELDNTNALYWGTLGYCYKNGIGTEID